jgi:hypothetical protein
MKRTYADKMEELYKNCSIVQVTKFALAFWLKGDKGDPPANDILCGKLFEILKEETKDDAQSRVQWEVNRFTVCSYPWVEISSVDPVEVRRLGWIVYSYLKRCKGIVLNP